MSRRNDLKIRLLKIGLILLVLFELLPWRPGGPSITARATRVADLSSARPYYWWLSDHEVMTFRDPDKQDWTLLRRDLKAGTEMPLNELTQRFTQSGGNPDSVQVSPDGKWMLWTGLENGVLVATLDGKRFWREKSRHISEVRWHPDSRRWIEIVEADEMYSYVILHSVEKPQKGVGKPIFPAIPAGEEMVDSRNMALTADEHLLVCYWNETTGDLNPIARIRAAGFNANPGNTNKIIFQAPRPSLFGEIVFHPPVGRLVWVLECERPWSLLGILGLSVSTDFWISELKGGGSARPVGSLLTKRFGIRGAGPYNVRWTPDGKRLSFVYENALWTVPVE